MSSVRCSRGLRVADTCQVSDQLAVAILWLGPGKSHRWLKQVDAVVWQLVACQKTGCACHVKFTCGLYCALPSRLDE
jgi:hypothetical protein